MASSRRRTDSSIRNLLFQRGWEFEFFQAVRLLSRLFPERKAIAGSARPSDEFVRFRTLVSLTFPASPVDFVEGQEGTSPAQMTVTFFGLTGTQGVLPTYYTECLLAEKTAKKETLADFLDLFNHRLLSLFYAAWQKHRPPVLYERALLERQSSQAKSVESTNGAVPLIDSFTHSLFDLIGMGTRSLFRRMSISDESLLLYAGLIGQRPRSASALRGILRDYFSIPVEIDQCLGSWYELSEADRSYLAPESERNQLGVGAFLGDKVWDQQSRFRIRLGPLNRRSFEEFLPDGRAMAKLRELVRFLVGQALSFEVQLFLLASEVPHLSVEGDLTKPSQLGWTSWLKTSSFENDAGDATFTYLT